MPAERRRGPCSDAETDGASPLGGQIEELYGPPMDIEWALSLGVFVLQARPITALPEPAGAASAEWSLP